MPDKKERRGEKKRSPPSRSGPPFSRFLFPRLERGKKTSGRGVAGRRGCEGESAEVLSAKEEAMDAAQERRKREGQGRRKETF